MTKQGKQEIKTNYPCGKCNKNVTSNSRAVLCRSNCLKWYHLKCTKLTVQDFKELKKTNIIWTCNICMNKQLDVDFHVEASAESDTNYRNKNLLVDREVSQEEIITNEINMQLREQLENVNCVLETVNGDLVLANEEIKSLKNQKTSLEFLILQKEEEIIKLQMEINQLKHKSTTGHQEDYFTSAKKTCKRKRYSLPNSITLKKMSSNEKKLNYQKNQKKQYTAVNQEKKSKFKVNSDSSFLNEPNSRPNFTSENYYQVLTPPDDGDHENSEPDSHGEVNKILICADSHGRDLSWHLNTQINKNRRSRTSTNKEFKSIGFVNPGGRTSQVLNERNIKEELLNKEDILVIVSGTNDVARNEGDDALKKIKDTLDMFKENQIILVDLPNRYDLANWSCVNLETKKTNKELKKLSETYFNVTLVEASKAERHMHTSHGMHLKPKGKTWLAEKICEAIGISSLQPMRTSPSGKASETETSNSGNGQSTRENPPPLILKPTITES